VIIPVGHERDPEFAKNREYAMEVKRRLDKQLLDLRPRIRVDERGRGMTRAKAVAREAKAPYMCVVGQREFYADTVAVTRYDGETYAERAEEVRVDDLAQEFRRRVEDFG
jgi:threonyl-tRNA synthetase